MSYSCNILSLSFSLSVSLSLSMSLSLYCSLSLCLSVSVYLSVCLCLCLSLPLSLPLFLSLWIVFCHSYCHLSVLPILGGSLTYQNSQCAVFSLTVQFWMKAVRTVCLGNIVAKTKKVVCLKNNFLVIKSSTISILLSI